MTQKTFKTAEKFEVGDNVLLYSKQPEGKAEIFNASKKYAKTGYPGNMNNDICRFHGWRGTSYGTATYAYGVREVIKVVLTDEEDFEGRQLYKVTVGKDLVPEQE